VHAKVVYWSETVVLDVLRVVEIEMGREIEIGWKTEIQS
jgi:hypothetical protein